MPTWQVQVYQISSLTTQQILYLTLGLIWYVKGT